MRHLPKYHGKTFTARARADKPDVNRLAPAFGRKAVIYATCFANYNNPRDRHGRAQGAGAQRRRDRGGLPALLRDAAARVRRPRPGRRARRATSRRPAAVGRQGLRHRLAGAVVQPDAEVRVAADRARRRRHQGAEPGHLRCGGVHRRHPAQGRAGRRHEAAARRRHRPHRLPCPRPEHGPEGDRDAASCCRRPRSR